LGETVEAHRAPGATRRIGLCLVVGGVCVILAATLTPDRPNPGLDHFCVACGALGGVDAVLNILLFAPLGLGLGLMAAPARRSIAAMFALTVSIELLQLYVIPGRNASIGDVLTNTLGGALGFVLGRSAFRIVAPDRGGARRLLVAWTIAWLAMQSTVAFAFSPRMPEGPYFGQVTAFPDDVVKFPGEMLAVRIDSDAVVDGPLGGTERMRDGLSRGRAAAFARAVVGDAPRKRAAMFRVAATRDRGVLSLEQSRNDLVFAVRTGADQLRLRPFEFRFHAGLRRGDTVQIRAAYSVAKTRIEVASADGDRARVFTPRLSKGWRLVTPFQTTITDDGADIALSMLFLAACVLPLGYWARGTVAARRRTVLPAALLALALAGLGLLAVPAVFGMAVAAPWEWAAAVAGVAAGIMGSRAVSAVRNLNDHRGIEASTG